MNAVFLMLMGLGAMALGYFMYSKFICEKIFQVDPNFRTPAHELQDGVDYVPTNKYILWGHHFTSVAGAAPILGPAIAVIWGWVPAFLWVVFGTIFFAGVHDAGAIWASSRNKARSIGALTGDIVGNRARSIFMIVIFLVLLMVNAVFAVVIANQLINFPSATLPVWGAIVVALIIGQLIYRKVIGLLMVTILGVTALYGMIYLGPMLPFSLPTETMLGLTDRQSWIILLFVYAAIASLLPVWALLQPRDYINGIQLFIGLGLLYGAVLLASPDVVAPAFNREVPAGTPSLIPLLFVTIACGAISGFHGLVASGTTSKQLDKEPDLRFVGYFGAVGEGALALAAIIAVSAGFATLADWQAIYHNFGQGGVAAFTRGGANILEQGLGLDTVMAQTLLTVMVVLFAGTTMDTGLRLQRYIFQEWGSIYRIGWMQKTLPATLLAVGCCLLLAFGAGGDGAGGMLIWPLFGTTNQLLARLTLLVITVMLVKLGRPMWYTLAPLLFLLCMTTLGLLIQLKTFYDNGDWFLFTLDIVILAAAILVILEASSALTKQIKANKVVVPEP
ncbi:carbon starvation CstA family protein [Alkalimonas amylolytica]|uniref:Carbon starvation protein n=1 Tax=Alkalimonas amylolytica TaxID=152573 RepID=A0A1H3ZQZ9_ALKAM|nr:carbon starvation protein A [Alkalimonas amylolytica]SEA25791.1 carbon starvation protein [Alkalimonas amylolytica]